MMRVRCKNCIKSNLLQIIYVGILPGIEYIVRIQSNLSYQYLRIGEKRLFPFLFKNENKKGLIEFINSRRES